MTKAEGAGTDPVPVSLGVFSLALGMGHSFVIRYSEFCMGSFPGKLVGGFQRSFNNERVRLCL